MRGLRVEPTEALEKWSKDALERGELTVPSRSAAARIATLLCRDGNLIHLVVPRGGDEVERVLLDLATNLGGDVVSEVDEILSRQGKADQAIQVLARAIRGRSVVVEGLDELGRVGGDKELALVLADRANGLRAWLSEFSQIRVGQPSFWPQRPLRLANGSEIDLPEGTTPRAAGFQELLASYSAVVGAPQVPDDLGEVSLRSQISGCLPPGMRSAALLASVHARPFPDLVAERLRLTSAFARLVQVGIAHRVKDGVRVDSDWRAHWCEGLSEQLRIEAHRKLAEAFSELFSIDSPVVSRVALHVVEAHRHYTAAGEAAQAIRLARYGAHLLAARARQLSLERRFADAARLYGELVSIAGPQRLRAYVRHYLHFNRARAQLEPIADTAEGYGSAVTDWRENALFWSRRIRAHFYMGDRTRALAFLAEAKAIVPEHPEKAAILVARTTRGLLEKNHVEDAVEVWGTYEPTSSVAADEVFEMLKERLEEGFTTKRLLVGEKPTVFLREQDVRVVQLPRGWRAELPRLDLKGGIKSSPRLALADVVTTLRNEALRLLRTYTHRLDAEGVKRKSRILGSVDVVASEIEPFSRKIAWVMGNLELEGGKTWLSDGRAWFEVPSSVLERGPYAATGPYLAEVACEHSIPRGPVMSLTLVATRDPDEIWAAWAARQHEVESSAHHDGE